MYPSNWFTISEYRLGFRFWLVWLIAAIHIVGVNTI